MTYNISIYTLSPSDYRRMIEDSIKDVSGMQLLIQSGGINSTGSKDDNFGAKRSPYFHNDFYIDNVMFKSLISGTSVQSPHNHFELNFTITEPMGITFMESLYNSIIKYNTDNGVNSPGTFLGQNYLMVVRFYGYDENGKQVSGDDTETFSDNTAYIEKWIPFQFTNITFRLETDKVVYACTAVTPQSQVANDQIHGIIPFNIGLQGQKIGDLVGGNQQGQLKEKTVVSIGLEQALNNWQQKLYSEGLQSKKDVYKFEFEDDEIKNAVLVSPGTSIVHRTGMANDPDPAALLKASTKESQLAKGVRGYAVNAGMKIMKFLDLAIRTSSYISDQYRQVNDGNADYTTKFKGAETNTPLKWYKIRPRIKQLEFDKKRNQWAYEITYVISRYDVKSLNTKQFSSNQCYYPHKSYDYWFTGKNTEVLNFFQNYDFLYYSSFGQKYKDNPDKKAVGPVINAREIYAYRSQTNQSAQGDENAQAQQAANAASVIYSPADQAQVELDIVGDPDWIGQSELFYAASAVDERNPVMPDGSINYDAAEVYFAVNFNTIVDYNLRTGLADATAKNVKDPYGAGPGGLSQYSFIYRANVITTQLHEGRFVQKLEGTLMEIPQECVVEVKTTDIREENTPSSSEANKKIRKRGQTKTGAVLNKSSSTVSKKPAKPTSEPEDRPVQTQNDQRLEGLRSKQNSVGGGETNLTADEKLKREKKLPDSISRTGT